MDKIKQLLKLFLTHKSDNQLLQLIRYLVSGGCSFCIDFGTLFILTEFVGIHYLISSILAFILAMTTNYLISILWVFNKRKMDNTLHEFGIFMSISVTGLALNTAFMWTFTEYINLHYLISKIVATALVFFWNFTAKRNILFK